MKFLKFVPTIFKQVFVKEVIMGSLSMDEFGYLSLTQSHEHPTASYCPSECVHMLNQLTEKDGCLFINKISDVSNPKIKQNAKSRIIASHSNSSEINEEVPYENRFRCSRKSLLVFILRMAITLTFIAVLSICIVKMEMLQKKFGVKFTSL